ncbi:MAG: NAD(P)/FAD-dependent oxidoreductase [Pseudomonadales bacterium]
MSKTPSTIRIGRRYRPNRLDGPYDMVVIGSGIGGLTAAACLAKMGKKVCVLEQHYTAGGFTHSYERNGYEWDVGVHYIGDVGSSRAMGRRLFDYVTDGALEWEPMDDHFDRIFLGPEQFDLVAGKVAYREALVAAFPEEEQAIDTYLRYMRGVKDGVRLYTLNKIIPAWASKAVGKIQQRKSPAFFNQTTREVLESITDNQKLIAVLTGQWGDCGLPPAKSSFIIHSMIAQHYINGGFYPVGGASRMAETILPVIQQAGGDVFTYASVEKILVNDKGAYGVRMADGHEIEAPIVISNAGVFNTFNDLLDDEVPQREAYLAHLQQVEPSMASICLYIGIKDTAENLQLPKTNFWIYGSENYEADIATFDSDPDSGFPMVYISFPSAKDPSFESRYPGRATIEIVAPGPHDWFAQWADKPWGKRGDDYEALKERLSQRLLKSLYEKLPQLEGKIDYYELSTSLSTDFFCRYKKGEIYGLDHTPQRFEQDWLKPKTDIAGLYLTGQDIMTCGVMGAMVGGLLTAIQLGGLKGLKLGKQMFL